MISAHVTSAHHPTKDNKAKAAIANFPTAVKITRSKTTASHFSAVLFRFSIFAIEHSAATDPGSASVAPKAKVTAEVVDIRVAVCFFTAESNNIADGIGVRIVLH